MSRGDGGVHGWLTQVSPRTNENCIASGIIRTLHKYMPYTYTSLQTPT